MSVIENLYRLIVAVTHISARNGKNVVKICTQRKRGTNNAQHQDFVGLASYFANLRARIPGIALCSLNPVGVATPLLNARNGSLLPCGKFPMG